MSLFLWLFVLPFLAIAGIAAFIGLAVGIAKGTFILFCSLAKIAAILVFIIFILLLLSA